MIFEHISHINTSSKTLICLHGWGYTFKDDSVFIKEAQKSFHVISLILPGYIHAPPTTYQTIDLLADSLKQTLRALPIDHQTVFMGHSMGALITLPIIRDFPELRILLSGCPFRVHKPWYAPLLLHFPTLISILGEHASIRNYFIHLAQKAIAGFSQKKSASAYTGDADTKTAFFNLVAIAEFDPALYIQDIQKHLHIKLVYGDTDPNRYTAQAQHLQYTTIPGAGHSGMDTHAREYIQTIFDLSEQEH